VYDIFLVALAKANFSTHLSNFLCYFDEFLLSGCACVLLRTYVMRLRGKNDGNRKKNNEETAIANREKKLSAITSLKNFNCGFEELFSGAANWRSDHEVDKYCSSGTISQPKEPTADSHYYCNEHCDRGLHNRITAPGALLVKNMLSVFCTPLWFSEVIQCETSAAFYCFVVDALRNFSFVSCLILTWNRWRLDLLRTVLS